MLATADGFINGARKELLIYDTGLTDDRMIALLKARAEAGVKIRVLGRSKRSGSASCRGGCGRSRR